MKLTKEHVQFPSAKALHPFVDTDIDEVEQELRAICAELNFFFAHIDGKSIRNELDLFHTIEKVFMFPENYKATYQPNWDGIRDRLRDLEWLFERPVTGKIYSGCVVYYSEPLNLASEYNMIIFIDNMARLTQSFQERYHKENKIPFHVFLGPVNFEILTIINTMTVHENVCRDELK